VALSPFKSFIPRFHLSKESTGGLNKYKISDIENDNLNVVSNIRPNRLFTADENIVLYKVGKLKKDKMDEVVRKVLNMFQI
jgi:hypothetical protein